MKPTKVTPKPAVVVVKTNRPALYGAKGKPIDNTTAGGKGRPGRLK